MADAGTDYQIVCVDKESDHGHISRVGVTSDGGANVKFYDLDNALALGLFGMKLHTGSTNSGDYTPVSRMECPHCDRQTLRSHADATTANNLDELGPCV